MARKAYSEQEREQVQGSPADHRDPVHCGPGADSQQY